MKPLTGVDRVYLDVEYVGQANYEARLKISLSKGDTCTIHFQRATDDNELTIKGAYFWGFTGRDSKSSMGFPLDKDYRITVRLEDGRSRWALKGQVTPVPKDFCLAKLLEEFPLLHKETPSGRETNLPTGNGTAAPQFSCAGMLGKWKWASLERDEKSEAFLEISRDGEELKGKYWQRKRKLLKGDWADSPWSQVLSMSDRCTAMTLSGPGNCFSLGAETTGPNLWVDVMTSISDNRLPPGFILFIPKRGPFSRTDDPAPH